MRNFLIVIFLLVLSLDTFGGPGTFPQGDHVKNLKDKIEFKNTTTQIISNDSDDPTSVAKEAAAGSVYLRTTGEIYVKQDAGSSTNWLPAMVSTLAELNDLSDVNIISPSISSMLTYDGVEWSDRGSSQLAQLYENFICDEDFVTKYGVGDPSYNAFGTMPQTVPARLPDYPTGVDIDSVDLNIGDEWTAIIKVQFKDLSSSSQFVLIGTSAAGNAHRDFLIGYIPSSGVLYIDGGLGETGYSVTQNISADINPNAINTISVERDHADFTIVINGTSIYTPAPSSNTAEHVFKNIGESHNVATADLDGYVESYMITSVVNGSSDRSGVFSTLSTVDNGSVYYNSVSRVVREYQSGFWNNRNPSTIWKVGVQYAQAAVVFSRSNAYVAKVQHTSVGPLITDDIANWDQLTASKIQHGETSVSIPIGDQNIIFTTNDTVAMEIDTAQNVAIAGELTADNFQFDTSASEPAYSEGKIFYDGVNKTLALFNDEADSTLQLGQEMWKRVKNDTGGTILNGQVCYINGINGTGVNTIALAKADAAITSISTLGIATHDIENGTIGYITTLGTVRDVNTLDIPVASPIWLSADTAGAFTATPPSSPDYLVSLGIIGDANTVTGALEVHIEAGSNTQDVLKVFNGAILEDHTVTTSSDGATVTVALERAGGGDLSLFFDGAFSFFDTSPAATVTLTAGSDVTPILNYVYIPKSTMVMTANTTGFPEVEQHTHIATVLVQSAASVQTDGPYKEHAWTDHLSDSIDEGHLVHVNEWIRNQHATWLSGVLPTFSGDGTDTVEVGTSSGVVLQLHEHAFDAMVSASDIYVVNDSVTPYKKITNLVDIDLDSTGASLRNKTFALVLWGSVNENTGVSKLFINLPSGSEGTNKANQVREDKSKETNYSIPEDFKGTGFLIHRLVMDVNAGGTVANIYTDGSDDIRGQVPNTAAGTSGGVISDFEDGTFSIFNTVDNTKELTFDVSGVTASTAATLTIPDGDGTLLLMTGLAGGQTIIGDTASGGDLTLQSTSNATRGEITVNDAINFLEGLWFDGVELITNVGQDLTIGLDSNTIQLNGNVKLGTGTLDASSKFNIFSTTQGSQMCPTMTTVQKDAISTPDNGLCVYDSDLDKYFAYNGAQWKELGSSASGINYITNNSNPANTDGYATYDDGAVDLPVDGTGGSPTIITFATNAITPIRDVADFRITKASGSCQGEGVSYDFTVDAADSPKVLQIEFDYITDTNYVDGDLRMYVIDTDGGQVIESTNRDVSAIAQGGHYLGEFQTLSTSTNYRLAFHCTDTGTPGWYAQLTGLSVGPGKKVTGYSGSDTIDFTPGTMNGFSASSISGKYTKFGQWAKIQITAVSSGAVTAQIYIPPAEFLPSGLSIDTDALEYDSASQVALSGGWNARDTSGGGLDSYAGTVYLDGAQNLVPVGDDGTDRLDATKPFSGAWVSGDTISFDFWVPIAGWSSNTQSSDSASQRVVGLDVSPGAATGTVTSSFNDITFSGTVVKDTHAAFDGTTWVTPASGWYTVSATMEISFSSQSSISSILRIAVDGADRSKSAHRNNSTGAVSLHTVSKTHTLYLIKGEEVTIQSWSNASSPVLANSLAGNQLSIVSAANPATISATEKVVAFYRDDAGQSTANSGEHEYDWDTKVTDSHSMYDGSSEFIIPRADVYTISGAIVFQAVSWGTTDVNISIRVNGPDPSGVEYIIDKSPGELATQLVSTKLGLSGTIALPLNKGDTIAFEVGHANSTAVSTQANTASLIRNWISITSQGGI